MSAGQNHILKQIGRYALVAALLVSQAAWVSHGHPPASSDTQAFESGLVSSLSGSLASATVEDHRHDPAADVDCLLCLAADLTPIEALHVDHSLAAHRALVVATSVDSPTLIQSILAYQTRAPPLFTTA